MDTLDLERCSICNGKLTRQKFYQIFWCEDCEEYFPVGVSQFDQVFGTSVSFTARKIKLLTVYGKAAKFCNSVNQLLKSDLDALAMGLEDFQKQEQIVILAQFIRQHKPLKSLQITMNDRPDLKILTDAIETSTRISKLHLDIYRSNGTIQHINSMLKNNRSIRTLSIHCSFPMDLLFDGGISENQVIEELRIVKCSSLERSISFGNIKSLEIVGDLFPKQLLQDAFTVNKSIKTLILDDNSNVISTLKFNMSITTLKIRCFTYHTPVSFVDLSELFKCHPALTYVSLYFHTEIMPEEIQLICNGIQESKSIRKFHFQQHEYTLLDVATLLNTFMQRKQSEDIKIKGVSYGTDLSAIIKALQEPRCPLKKLSFSGIPFNTDQTLALALALEAHGSLEYINFDSTNFSSEALKVIQRWLSNNSQLKGVKFASLEDAQFDLAEIIRRNTTLTKLHYRANLSPDQLDKVVNVLTLNDTLTNIRFNDQPSKLFSTMVHNPNFNRALRKIGTPDLWSFERITQRNIEYQSLMIINTKTIIHNIVRDQSVLERLPREIWLLIFEMVRFPGTFNFRSVAERTFKLYPSKELTVSIPPSFNGKCIVL